MPRPDPSAELQALTAMALELTRVDPDRRPGPDLQRWHQELATILGSSASATQTNRDLLRDALRLRELRRSALAASPV